MVLMRSALSTNIALRDFVVGLRYVDVWDYYVVLDENDKPPPCLCFLCAHMDRRGRVWDRGNPPPHCFT